MSRDRIQQYATAVVLVILATQAGWANPRASYSSPPQMMAGMAVLVLLVFWVVGSFMAAVWMPNYRRTKGLFWPRSLPRVRHRGGFTLIELLIVIAVVAILMPPFVRLTAQGRIAAERESLSRESLALAQDEMAWLRAQPSLPAPGVHPIDPQIVALHKTVAPMARLEISQTSGPLVQARVRVDLQSKGIGTPISVAALIAPRKEARP